LAYIGFTQFYPWVKLTLLPSFTQYYPKGFTQWVKRTMPTLATLFLWNGTMFGDLDWPLNASRGLTAIAEFLVNTVITDSDVSKLTTNKCISISVTNY